MKWKGKLLVTLGFIFISVASFKVGTAVGVIVGYGIGAETGALSQDARIKAFCDSEEHTIFWGKQRYRCVPGTRL